MKIKFDLSGAVKKVTGVNEKLGGDANIDAHFEVEFGADELGTIYEAQRALVPEVLSFIKEMQQITTESRRLDEKIDDLEYEKNKLENKLGDKDEQISKLEEEIKDLKYQAK